MRSAVLILSALLLLTSCAHAEVEERPIVRAIARVMVAALPREQVAHTNTWDALSARVSRHMHWRLAPPDAADRPVDAIIRRAGWIQSDGDQVFVSAEGVGERVRALTFETHSILTLSVLDALREEGANVSFQADWEESSEYVISADGAESALLTSARVCMHSEDRTGQTCSNVLTLAFELP